MNVMTLGWSEKRREEDSEAFRPVETDSSVYIATDYESPKRFQAIVSND